MSALRVYGIQQALPIDAPAALYRHTIRHAVGTLLDTLDERDVAISWTSFAVRVRAEDHGLAVVVVDVLGRPEES